MGAVLSSPVTEKFSSSGDNADYYYGVSSMQGWRVSMEDAHTTELTLSPDSEPRDRVAFFGVFDGHGGEKTALFAGERTYALVAATEAYKRQDYRQALIDGFLATDEALLRDTAAELDGSGCAATTCLLTPSAVICGNAGDSRSVLGRAGVAKSLSFDHKPDNEGERARIAAAGGFVDMGRVNGNLALSRAMGDFGFKKSPQLPPEQQVVTVVPDIIEVPLTERDEFVLLACDGIWDCMDSQQVIEFVRRAVADGLELHEICELLMDECLTPQSDMSGIGCDNMTVCVVALLNGKTKAEWYDMVKQRVARNDGPVAARSASDVREAITARHQGTRAQQQAAQQHPMREEGASAQLMLQQIFGGGEGAPRLNPEATSFLSKLGIRFPFPAEVDEEEEETPNDEEANEE